MRTLWERFHLRGAISISLNIAIVEFWHNNMPGGSKLGAVIRGSDFESALKHSEHPPRSRLVSRRGEAAIFLGVVPLRDHEIERC